jgi:hypothetical protein
VLCRTADTYWDGPPAGINEFEKNGIKAFPNPVKDALIISSGGEIRIRLSDVFGRELFSASAFQLARIDLSAYAPGVYLLQVSQNGKTYGKKILKTN